MDQLIIHPATILSEMRCVLKEYAPVHGKIWKHVTDSGSNMVCAFRNAFDDDLSEEEAEAEQAEEDDAGMFGDIHLCEILEPDTRVNQRYSRLSCFIHTLLLCLKKFDARKIFQNLLIKAKDLVAKFSSSQVLTGELVKLCGLKLVKFSNTRWNVVYLVVQRLILVRESLTKVLTACAKTKYDFTNNEWNLMLQMRDFLAPFNRYTDMSSTEGGRSISEVVMMIKQLKEHLSKFFGIRNFGIVSKEILRDLECRFGHFFAEAGTKSFEGAYLASTALDPRFRIALTPAEVNLVTTFISNSNWYSDNDIQEQIEAMPATSSAKKRKFEFLDSLGQASDINIGLGQELELYMQNKCFDTDDDKHDPWVFWNSHKSTFPKLAPISLDILSIPLSIAVERVFSFSGLAT